MTIAADESVGPWAQEKLECLRKYLAAYTTILRNQAWCAGYIFVDAFAGAGQSILRSPKGQNDIAEVGLFDGENAESGDQGLERYIDGSPRVALTIQHPFTHYIFVERNPKRLQKLEALKGEFRGKRSIEIVRGDAIAALKSRVLHNPGLDWKRHRAVIFLDPFGMQVPWEIVASLGRTRAIEVIVNFPLGMGIQRLLETEGRISESRRRKLDTFFGSPNWETAAYETSPDLFGPKTAKATDAGIKILEFYRQRLKEAFGQVSVARLIRNSRGGHLYYLIWAGHNATGLKIASHVLGQGEELKPK